MTCVPVVNLIQGGAVVITRLRLLICYEIFYLARPVDHNCLQSLDLVFLSGTCFDIVKFLCDGDVKLCSANSLMGSFGYSAHEHMEVGCEFLLDTIRPFIFTEESWAEVLSHLA
jgi:hypothetical protein